MSEPGSTTPAVGPSEIGAASPAGDIPPGAAPVADPGDRGRSADLALARLHLRSGSLALARAELETMAGRDALDEDGLVDLAEARWRTGDTAGAGEAAAVLLGEAKDGPLMALVVAAEAAVQRGRPSEARRYAARALEVSGGAIDDVFAGMPRGPMWPADAAAVDGPAPTLFDLPPAHRAAVADDHGSSRDGALMPADDEATSQAVGELSAPVASEASAPVVGEVGPATLALWGDAALGPQGARPSHASASAGDERWDANVAGVAATGGVSGLPSGDQALRAGQAALAEDRAGEASTQLGLALRLSPALAAEVLDILAGRRDPTLAFVRGDALRLLGREDAARLAYADALGSNAEAPSSSVEEAGSSGEEASSGGPAPHDPIDRPTTEGDTA